MIAQPMGIEGFKMPMIDGFCNAEAIKSAAIDLIALLCGHVCGWLPHG
jgi:hypothetical protein